MDLCLNADPIHGYPTEWLADTKTKAIRFPLLDSHNYRAFMDDLDGRGVQYLPVLTLGSFPGKHWSSALRSRLEKIKRRYPNIKMLEVGNEWDTPNSDPSWYFPPNERYLLNRLLSTVREVFGPDLTLVLGGMCHGDPADLDTVDLSGVDIIALHPYTYRADTLYEILDAYRVKTDKPFWITEWGEESGWWAQDPSGQARVYSEMFEKARELGVEKFFVFCYSQEVPVFGMFGADGNPLETGAAFIDGVEPMSSPLIPVGPPLGALVPIFNTEGEDIHPIVAQAARDSGVDEKLVLACAIAESGLNPKAARIGNWPDVSFGYGQQIVLYHYFGDHSNTPENIAAVREHVFANPGENLIDMANRLSVNVVKAQTSDLSMVGGDEDLAALIIYNAGHFPSVGESYWKVYGANVDGYRHGLARASNYLGVN